MTRTSPTEKEALFAMLSSEVLSLGKINPYEFNERSKAQIKVETQNLIWADDGAYQLGGNIHDLYYSLLKARVVVEIGGRVKTGNVFEYYTFHPKNKDDLVQSLIDLGKQFVPDVMDSLSEAAQLYTATDTPVEPFVDRVTSGRAGAGGHAR